MYIFPLILYYLSVLPLPKDHRVALKRSLFKLLWKGRSSMVRRQVFCQHPRNGGLESHLIAEKLAYLGCYMSKDTVWGQKMIDVFPRIESNSKAEGRRKSRNEAPFAREYRMISVTFLGPMTFLGIERNRIGSVSLSLSLSCWSPRSSHYPHSFYNLF